MRTAELYEHVVNVACFGHELEARLELALCVGHSGHWLNVAVPVPSLWLLLCGPALSPIGVGRIAHRVRRGGDAGVLPGGFPGPTPSRRNAAAQAASDGVFQALRTDQGELTTWQLDRGASDRPHQWPHSVFVYRLLDA